MKTGFVNIFGRPNAGKSTLLNALMGEKLAIVSPKVQTTRHRIKAIMTEKDYQIIFSDTPGIIEPKYKLHEKMMQSVKGALEDADVALLIVDVNENWEECNVIFEALQLKVPAEFAKIEIEKNNEILSKLFFMVKVCGLINKLKSFSTGLKFGLFLYIRFTGVLKLFIGIGCRLL